MILGGEKVKPTDVDMRWIGAIFSCNDVVEETGLAAGVLGHPANGIAWVARRLAPYGLAIEPGQIVLAGSFTRGVDDSSWRSVRRRLRAARHGDLQLRLSMLAASRGART